MASTAIRKVELKVGEVIEVDGRKYEVAPARDGEGVTLETWITPMSELHRRWGTRSATDEEFDRLFGDAPTDDEG